MAEKAGRKRVRLKEGDLFELTVPDGRVGYGIIVRRGGGVPYIAIFEGLYDGRPDVVEIDREVVFAGWTMDALIHHGRWQVIARGVEIPTIPFPNFKVGMSGKVYVTDVDGKMIRGASSKEVELLDYQFSTSPITFQHAFEALHGFGESQGFFEKLKIGYAATHIVGKARWLCRLQPWLGRS